MVRSPPLSMKYRTILLFGAPGAGKGTQGKILGTIPNLFHCACGDVYPASTLIISSGMMARPHGDNVASLYHGEFSVMRPSF